MFGASSMGALRAAECAPYGFVALGAIAGWYVRESIDGDDEVAVLTHPQSGRAITVPVVNVRHVARLARRRGLLSRAGEAQFIASAREIYYMDRSWDGVIACAPPSIAKQLHELIMESGDLKRLDARFALRTVIRTLQRTKDARIPFVTKRPACESARESGEVRLPSTSPKDPSTYDRATSYASTLDLAPELRRRFGITRIADITNLDRVGIPVYSTLVPRSPDMLGVYNGKGLTRDASIASAIMEAAERQIAANVRLPAFEETVEAVSQHIDLPELGMIDVAPSMPVQCVRGTELLSGDSVAIPLALVQCPWFGEKLFDVTSTNGLASGNNIAEAVYHALCELVERHAWAMYHVRSSLVPRLFGGTNAMDRSVAPQLKLPTGDRVVDALIEKIESARLVLRAFLLEEAELPYTVFVSIFEPDLEPPMVHMGMGCSLSPAHALVRALTEAVQSRAIDIQGAREDMLRPDDPPTNMGEHNRRRKELPKDRWYFDLPAREIELSGFVDRSSDDVAQDVRTTLGALAGYGIRKIFAVELAPADLSVSVVRAIVPGLESFMYSGRLGSRTRALLNPFAVA